MKKDSFWGSTKGDSLSIDLKETAKSVVKGVVVLGIGIPLLLGASSILGGGE